MVGFALTSLQCICQIKCHLLKQNTYWVFYIRNYLLVHELLGNYATTKCKSHLKKVTDK